MRKFYYSLPITALVCSAIATHHVVSRHNTIATQPLAQQGSTATTLPGNTRPPVEPIEAEPKPEPGPIVTPPIPEPVPAPPEMIALALTSPEKDRIFQRVVDQQADLGLCEGSDNLAANLVDSDVYQRGEDQYLVSVLCFQAAYQGAYEFVAIDQDTLTHTQIALAGFPTFDLETSLLSNEQKFDGLGTCFENTDYYWDGYGLRLVSATLIDGIDDGCEAMGVRSPSADYLITNNSVGPAQLGMTFQAFQAQLSPATTLKSVPLGVDLPSGWQVNLYGSAQYTVAFEGANGENLPDAGAKLIMIQVDNPSYRTAEGVGPGTLLSEAIAHYGSATLSYNYEAESREFIEFANAPFTQTDRSQIWLRSNQWTLTDYAGIYPESSASYLTTTDYEDHGAIGSFWLAQTP